ncbi:MAG: amidohydrolase family protein [Mesorhizobium sp.]|nr:amidohydrolase family protein [Mesorhizobium sp.]MBL8579099.1 amidohydrolase family protein [Mesorhizobium sp.]
MSRIDSHQHFWKPQRGDYPWMTDDVDQIRVDFMPVHLRPFLLRHGISETILVQCTETIAETEFLLDLAGRTDFVRGVIGWVDLVGGTALADIERLASDALLLGIRPMVQWLADGWLRNPALERPMRDLQERGLVFEALVFPRQIDDLRHFLNRYPDLDVIIDHGAKPQIRDGQFEPWATAMRAIADNTRAKCKLSGLVTEARSDWSVDDLRPYVEHLLAVFGAERLMWGSDWPVSVLAGGYDPWVEATESLLATLPEGDREQIWRGTADRAYRRRNH